MRGISKKLRSTRRVISQDGGGGVKNEITSGNRSPQAIDNCGDTFSFSVRGKKYAASSYLKNAGKLLFFPAGCTVSTYNLTKDLDNSRHRQE